MIHRWISHNGQLLPVDRARLSPGQEGLINGWGLFTTLRAVDGQPFAFERHWRRLRRDSERTRVPLPFDEQTVLGQVMELLAANDVREGAIRIYMVWNRTGMWHSDEPFAPVDLIITTAPPAVYPEIVKLDVREHGRHAASALAGVKVTSWLNNVWSAAEAKKRGYDEVVMLNERGEVAECTAANVFCVRGGEVLTPPLSSGCLAGITREVLLEIAPESGVRLREAVLLPEDLYAATEVFISSTNRALLPVGEIAGHTIASAPGPITAKLAQAFADYLARYFAERASPATARGSS
ncbi:MAG TPA: aminotransferase class IV [Candidatus Acidoferrales bacterium]|nr:aminotransferase class IV [Candidatus Acidoferrales bacterium]